MLIDIIKEDLLNARKNRKTVKASFLSVVVGELELKSSKSKKKWTEKEEIAVVKSVKNSCKEMLKAGSHFAQGEIDILNTYLPEELEVRDILNIFSNENGLYAEIEAAEDPNRIMGKLMGLIKSKATKPFSGDTVIQAITIIQGK